MRLSVSFLVLPVCLALGCTGGSTTPSAPESTTSTPATAGATVSITDPWKSMNLPIDGARIDASDSEELAATYVTHTNETAAGIKAAWKDALTGAGWKVTKERDLPTSFELKLSHDTLGELDVDIVTSGERPVANAFLTAP